MQSSFLPPLPQDCCASIANSQGSSPDCDPHLHLGDFSTGTSETKCLFIHEKQQHHHLQIVQFQAKTSLLTGRIQLIFIDTRIEIGHCFLPIALDCCLIIRPRLGDGNFRLTPARPELEKRLCMIYLILLQQYLAASISESKSPK